MLAYCLRSDIPIAFDPLYNAGMPNTPDFEHTVYRCVREFIAKIKDDLVKLGCWDRKACHATRERLLIVQLLSISSRVCFRSACEVGAGIAAGAAAAAGAHKPNCDRQYVAR